MVYCVPDVIQPVFLRGKSEALLSVAFAICRETHAERVRSLTDKPRVNDALITLLNIGGSELPTTLMDKVVDLRLLLRLRRGRPRSQYVYCLDKAFKSVPVRRIDSKDVRTIRFQKKVPRFAHPEHRGFHFLADLRRELENGGGRLLDSAMGQLRQNTAASAVRHP